MDVLDYLYINGEQPKKQLPKEDTKTDVQGFYKTSVGSVICKDNESLDAYKKRKINISRLNKLETDVTSLKSDISEIKELLKGMVK